jgi:hypothetical protein
VSGTAPSLCSSDDEQLARFMTKKDWVRKDGTIRQDAFMPPRDLHLSVTSHAGLAESAIWQVGREVADQIPSAALHGRADVTVAQVRTSKLEAVPYPLPENANHVHIDRWPLDKDSQKGLALELSAAAGKVKLP